MRPPQHEQPRKRRSSTLLRGTAAADAEPESVPDTPLAQRSGRVVSTLQTLRLNLPKRPALDDPNSRSQQVLTGSFSSQLSGVANGALAYVDQTPSRPQSFAAGRATHPAA